MKKALSLILATIMLLGTLSVLCSLPVSAASWTAEQPKGSGTQEDPYLIATPGNFIWIQKNMNNSSGKNVDTDGDGQKDFATYEFGKTSFVGVYFEQVCDIDFEGAAIKAIGDYLCDTNEYIDNSKEIGKIYGGFGGVYNGNGFALKNATVTASNQNKTNDNWCVGLFGGIYGATLKNMVLSNIDVTANNPCSGILVGKAYAPAYVATAADAKTLHPDAGKQDFNVIENIVIDSECSVTATIPSGKTSITKDYCYKDGFKVGAIAGLAIGTTIRNCVNNGAITATAGYNGIGGMVGAAGPSIHIDSCINNGTITINTKPSTLTSFGAESGVGGMLGIVYAKGVYGSPDEYYAGLTGVRIENCLNTGATKNNAGTKLGSSNEAFWGGILGGINALTIATSVDSGKAYRIENCYNTAATTGFTRIGGIIGSAWNGAGNGCDSLYLIDSMSVDVAQVKYYGTNEFRCQKNATKAGLQSVVPQGLNAVLQAGTYKTAAGASVTAADGDAYVATSDADKTYATRALGDYIYVAKADGTGYELSTTTTFQNVVDELKADIELAQALSKAVVAIGHQKGLDGTNNEGAYRIVFGIHKLDYCNVGVSVIKAVEGGATTAAATNSDVVYSSVKAFTKDGEKEITAESKGVEYLTTLTIGDIPTTGTVTYTVKTYVTNRDTAKTRTAGDTVVLTFVNGALQSATVR